MIPTPIPVRFAGEFKHDCVKVKLYLSDKHDIYADTCPCKGSTSFTHTVICNGHTFTAVLVTEIPGNSVFHQNAIMHVCDIVAEYVGIVSNRVVFLHDLSVYISAITVKSAIKIGAYVDNEFVIYNVVDINTLESTLAKEVANLVAEYKIAKHAKLVVKFAGECEYNGKTLKLYKCDDDIYIDTDTYDCNCVHIRALCNNVSLVVVNAQSVADHEPPEFIDKIRSHASDIMAEYIGMKNYRDVFRCDGKIYIEVYSNKSFTIGAYKNGKYVVVKVQTLNFFADHYVEKVKELVNAYDNYAPSSTKPIISESTHDLVMIPVITVAVADINLAVYADSVTSQLFVDYAAAAAIVHATGKHVYIPISARTKTATVISLKSLNELLPDEFEVNNVIYAAIIKKCIAM